MPLPGGGRGVTYEDRPAGNKHVAVEPLPVRLAPASCQRRSKSAIFPPVIISGFALELGFSKNKTSVRMRRSNILLIYVKKTETVLT